VFRGEKRKGRVHHAKEHVRKDGFGGVRKPPKGGVSSQDVSLKGVCSGGETLKGTGKGQSEQMKNLLGGCNFPIRGGRKGEKRRNRRYAFRMSDWGKIPKRTWGKMGTPKKRKKVRGSAMNSGKNKKSAGERGNI